MEIDASREGGRTVLWLTGRLDAGNADLVEAELEEAIRRGEHAVTCDMEEVHYISSAGIRVLVKYASLLKNLGGSFAVARPSPRVASILEMTGLLGLFQAGGEEGEAAQQVSIQASSGTRTFDRFNCEIHELRPDPHPSLRARTFGNPEKLLHQVFSAEDLSSLSLPADNCALGLGAFGTDFEDCRGRFGEFLSAGGLTVVLPTDGSMRPDYMIAGGSLVPEVKALYGVALEGGFSVCLRFEAGEAERGVAMADLISGALEILGADSIGLAMLAESAGLIGATLTRPPIRPSTAKATEREHAHAESEQNFFSHPAIRDRLSFTPERVHDRGLTLVTGIAARREKAALAPFTRPYGRETDIRAHLHAAVFDYRALPAGPIPLVETVTTLAESLSPLAVLHLIRDDREFIGAGDSLPTRGALWAGPIETVENRAEKRNSEG